MTEFYFRQYLENYEMVAMVLHYQLKKQLIYKKGLIKELHVSLSMNCFRHDRDLHYERVYNLILQLQTLSVQSYPLSAWCPVKSYTH